MKDYIYLNYNIYVEKIYFSDNRHYFFINDYKIYIIKLKNEEISKVEKLIELTNNIYNKVKVNTFILNNTNKYFTKYDKDYIILMRVNNFENDFSLNYLYKFWNINSNIDSYNILDSWINEIDNLEKNVVEYNEEFPLIKKSINYYIGMAENAIELLNIYKLEIEKYNDSIGHKISYKLFDDNSLFDPFVFIRTNKMYDISNYIKYKFFKNETNYSEIETFLINNNDYENIFLFCNLLYPSVYFDLIKKIMIEKEEESKILSIIKLRKKYNKILIFCKKIVKNNINIQLINWIDK